jgi:hypothetical protein
MDPNDISWIDNELSDDEDGFEILDHKPLPAARRQGLTEDDQEALLVRHPLLADADKLF